MTRIDLRRLALLPPGAALSELRAAAGAGSGAPVPGALRLVLEWALEDPLGALVTMRALQADPQVRRSMDPAVRGLLRDAFRLFRERALRSRNVLKAAAWARAAALTGEPLDPELRALARPERARAFLALRLGRTRQAVWAAARDAGRASELEAALARCRPDQVRGWLLEAWACRVAPWQVAPEEVAGPLRAAALAAAELCGLDPRQAARDLLMPFTRAEPARLTDRQAIRAGAQTRSVGIKPREVFAIRTV